MTTPEFDFDRSDEILRRIKQGQVFVTPTDTAYGLGASLEDTEAVRRVFEIKNRSPEKSIPVLMDRQDLGDEFTLTDVERRAIEVFWPGALTLVLTVKNPEQYPDGVTRERTIAVREPAYELLLALLRKAGPVTGTSANKSGDPTPGSPEEIDPAVLDAVDFVLKGSEAPGDGSTVAEWNEKQDEWIIHRDGPIVRQDLTDRTVGSLEEDPTQ